MVRKETRTTIPVTERNSVIVVTAGKTKKGHVKNFLKNCLLKTGDILDVKRTNDDQDSDLGPNGCCQTTESRGGSG